jgi:hypothetical protein
MTTMHKFAFLTPLWALLSGCGVEFDSLGQLDGLRVLGVHKDLPVAHPGDEVQMQMVVHDTGDADGKSRALTYMWLGGCNNPLGDTYQGCLPLFAQVSENLGDLFNLDPATADPEQLQEAALALEESGLSFGFSDTFTLEIPSNVITSKPAGPTPGAAEYALSYTFFAACAGELRPDPESETFPVACFDGDEKLGARDFVAGYTSTFTYPDQRNSLPKIIGMHVGGKKVAKDLLCVGEKCETPTPNPERRCPKGVPTVKRCDSGTVRQLCPELPVWVDVDPNSVDQDSPQSLGGPGMPEPMWVNYHTDSGSFTSDVSLINDTISGFRAKPETKFLAPERPGPAYIYAAVRDNRGGFDWARTTVCVK